MWVRNDTDELRTVTVDIADGPEGDPWFRRAYDFEPGARLVVQLRSVRSYAVTVRADGSGDGLVGRETVAVPESWIDCNDSGTDVVVRETEVESQTVSTTMCCGGPW